MNKNQVFDLLWQRTRERGEFPALQRALSAIASTMQDDMASTAQLAATVLGDFTLTQKVLRLANSAMYAPYGQDVTTVSRALMILGSSTVAHIAMGIQLLDTFEGLTESRVEAAEELAQAAFAGKLAREFATMSGEKVGEEAAVSTLMYQLSRLLVVFYLPEEWRRIRACLDRGLSEDDAFLEVLGVTPDELSEAAVEEWSLPHQVVRKSVPLPRDANSVAPTHAEWLACVAGLSTQLAEELTAGADEETVRGLVERYAPALGLDAERLQEKAAAMLASERKPQEVVELQSEQPRPLEGKPLDAERRLEKAIAEVSSTASEADVSTLTQLVMESMMHGLGLVSCAAFFRNSVNKTYEARVAFGQGMRDHRERMVFEDAFAPDVFHLALSQGRSIYLEDVMDAKIALRIPAWHKAVFPDVHSIVILPIRVKDRAIGLLYGNWGSQTCASGISAKEMDYLNSMRNVVTSAFEDVGRQSDRMQFAGGKAA
jgi:HD-like signal output (HDOD) protein